MATQTRTRTTAKQTGAGKNQPYQAPEESWKEQITSQWATLRGKVHAPAVSHRFRREIIAALLLLSGGISIYALITGDSGGPLVSWWSDALHWIAGDGAFLAPLFLLMAGIRAARQENSPLFHVRHYLGALTLACAITGMLALSDSVSDELSGGRIGLAVVDLLGLGLGELVSAFLLLAIGTLGVFLVVGMNPRTLGRETRRLFRVPQKGEMKTSPEPLAAPAKKQKVAQITSRALETRPLSDALPVINFPEADKKTATTPSLKPQTVREPDHYPLPDLSKLAYYEEVKLDPADLEATAGLIEETLASFKVEARVREINPGPAVTQFTLEPGQGVRVRRITELQNDLALALAAPSVRVEAPVPGMARVGVEIPNLHVATVGLRETLESQNYAKSKAKLPIPLGRDVNGRYAIHDLTKMPHLLIAGATGSGKSVCLNAIITTFLITRSPDEVRMLMIDPKMVELTGYNGVPHLQTPVITESDKVVAALRLVVQEMHRRYDLFNKAGVRNLDGYRMKIEDEPGAERVPYLVVIVDELADLMLTSPVEVENLLQRLAQMGRACGIHLILATQRPSVDVITGVIKANVPARLAFAVASLADSRVILDMPGAERLLGRGDMLFLPPDAAKPSRIQGAYVEDKDVHYVVGHWHSVAPIPSYPREWIDLPSSHSSSNEEYEDDPLMDRALEIVREQGTASASMLQRRLRIGYNRAARLIEQMESDGVIGPADGIKGRQVFMSEYS